MKKHAEICTIRFLKLRAEIAVAAGENLMKVLLQAGVPVASSCRGDGVCGKCRVTVMSGGENLSPELPLEMNRRLQLKIPANERLSCQAHVFGDVTIDTTYW